MATLKKHLVFSPDYIMGKGWVCHDEDHDDDHDEDDDNHDDDDDDYNDHHDHHDDDAAHISTLSALTPQGSVASSRASCEKTFSANIQHTDEYSIWLMIKKWDGH